jgi:hypothetical protein
MPDRLATVGCYEVRHGDYFQPHFHGPVEQWPYRRDSWSRSVSLVLGPLEQRASRYLAVAELWRRSNKLSLISRSCRQLGCG